MLPRCFEKNIRQQSIHDRTDPQRHNIDAGVRVQLIEFQDLQTGTYSAFSVWQPLSGVTGEGEAAQGVGCKISDGVSEGGEVVDSFQEGGHVDGHDAGHELRN